MIISKKDLVYFLFFIILFTLYFHLRSKKSNNKVEKFTNNQQAVSLTIKDIENVKKEIHKQYEIDIGAIRNLSELATKIQKEGLIVPGDLNVRGDFNYLPKGTIVAFNGTTAPSGWALCDGKNGTPNLTKKFIIGAGSGNFSLGNSGGSNKIAKKQIPKYDLPESGEHTHNMPFRYKNSYSTASGNGGPEYMYTDDRSKAFGPIAAHTKSTRSGMYGNIMNEMRTSSGHSHNSGGEGEDYWQPYYALSYIIKL